MLYKNYEKLSKILKYEKMINKKLQNAISRYKNLNKGSIKHIFSQDSIV